MSVLILPFLVFNDTLKNSFQFEVSRRLYDFPCFMIPTISFAPSNVVLKLFGLSFSYMSSFDSIFNCPPTKKSHFED